MTKLWATYRDSKTLELEVDNSKVDASVALLMEHGAIWVSIGKSQL
jgi:hypothetical protein